MAVRAIMLRKKIAMREAALDELLKREAEFETRKAENERAVEEAENDDQLTAIEEAMDAYESERAAWDQEVSDKRAEIDGLKEELQGIEDEQEKAPEDKPEPEERKDERDMMNREIKGVADMVTREDVKAYLGEVRAAMREKRALTNVGLTIPEVMLGMIKENIEGYSKLYSKVSVRRISGTGRMVIMGAVPEAVWTDCCANLNELSLGFNDVEVDCYKVGGYFAICNATLEDSDVNLAAELLSAIGQAIGLALDKAILYGRNAAGTAKMPQGIVPRLAEESQPAGYPATARPWVDLHTRNMITVSVADSAGVTLIKKLIGATGKISKKYARGALTWVMNETTYATIMQELVSVNAAGSVVTGLGMTMPVVGGDIVVLPFMADNQIVTGYFENYILAERAGQKFAQSEHVRFLADQTVFKGTARYDGVPAIAEAFAAIGINNTSPSANMTFASDAVNNVAPTAVILPATATVAVGAKISLAPALLPNNAVTTYTWSSATTAKATVDESGEVTGVAAGTSVITVATANGLTAQCTVTVTSA